jgi:hypothetical protein
MQIELVECFFFFTFLSNMACEEELPQLKGNLNNSHVQLHTTSIARAGYHSGAIPRA